VNVFEYFTWKIIQIVVFQVVAPYGLISGCNISEEHPASIFRGRCRVRNFFIPFPSFGKNIVVLKACLFSQLYFPPMISKHCVPENGYVPVHHSY
jgi:hypothetical protein